MHWAARNNKLNVVKTLVDLGADADARCSNGATALIVAVENAHGDIVELLIAGKTSIEAHKAAANSVLLVAADKGDVEVMKALLDQGAGVNTANSRKALHIAALEGHDEQGRSQRTGGHGCMPPVIVGQFLPRPRWCSLGFPYSAPVPRWELPSPRPSGLPPP